jgi:NOL1/NOP2/fmu family ribosome biogenesis protein
MFIYHALTSLLGNSLNLKALDLCAAPGGKTTLLASLPHFQMILANEIIQSRVSALIENIVKWGAHHVFVSNNDPRDLERLGDMFDVALVDAPCSGSGLFRKDENAQHEWSKASVTHCSSRQKRIMESASKVIKEGGYLVYSTCSFSKEENEDIVDFLIGSGMYESVRVNLLAEWGIVESVSDQHEGYGYRFYPDRLQGEGFFCAILKKITTDVASEFRPGSSALTFVKDTNSLKPWLKSSEGLAFYQKENEVFVCQENSIQDLIVMKEVLRLRRSGMRIGELIRNELIPDHELAMSTSLSTQLTKIELDCPTALKFLRRDQIEAEMPSPGWNLVQHKGVVLGWVKVVQGKLKNHYPMPWRILMRG